MISGTNKKERNEKKKKKSMTLQAFLISCCSTPDSFAEFSQAGCKYSWNASQLGILDIEL